MPGPVTTTFFDRSLEHHGLRQSGLLGRGAGLGSSLYAIDYDCLPPEARRTIALIVAGGPFPFKQDGKSFGNHFGDLPKGKYLEYTVRLPEADRPTEGNEPRGKRRIVARQLTGQLFFTACHYDRVGVEGKHSPDVKHAAQAAATAAVDPEWQNGFYVITGMMPALKQRVTEAIKALGD